MAKLMGILVKEKFEPGEKENSFYQESRSRGMVSRSYYGETPDKETLYYVDSDTGRLKAENTTILE